jgi:hypothetical protein
MTGHRAGGRVIYRCYRSMVAVVRWKTSRSKITGVVRSNAFGHLDVTPALQEAHAALACPRGRCSAHRPHQRDGHGARALVRPGRDHLFFALEAGVHHCDLSALALLLLPPDCARLTGERDLQVTRVALLPDSLAQAARHRSTRTSPPLDAGTRLGMGPLDRARRVTRAGRRASLGAGSRRVSSSGGSRAIGGALVQSARPTQRSTARGHSSSAPDGATQQRAGTESPWTAGEATRSLPLLLTMQDEAKAIARWRTPGSRAERASDQAHRGQPLPQ